MQIFKEFVACCDDFLHCTAQRPELEESQTRKDSDHREMLMFVKVQKYVMADEDRYHSVRAVKRREKEKVQSVLKSEIPMDQWHELVMQHADSTLST